MDEVTLTEHSPQSEPARKPRVSTPSIAMRPTGMEDVVNEIRPVKHRVRIRELFTSWAVSWVVAQRDIKVKYKQSILGRSWLVLQPLGVLVGLIVVFNGVTNVDTGGIPYILFALVSITAWTFVQQALTVGTNIFILNAFLVRRVAFPRSSLFTAAILGNAVPASVIFVISLVAVLIDRGLPIQVLLLPFLVVWFSVLLAGILFITASLTVRFRDMYALIPFWLQVGMFVTPVGYTLASAPGNLKTFLELNPMSGLLELWRWSVLGMPVELTPIITATVGTLLLVGLGWFTFSRMEVRFADYI
jgi:lipopolysaccharide transport system permease protein